MFIFLFIGTTFDLVFIVLISRDFPYGPACDRRKLISAEISHIGPPATTYEGFEPV